VYSLLALAATAFALVTVHFLSRPNWLRAALCAATGMALLYSHVYGIFAWAGINAGAAVVLLTRANRVAVDRKLWLAANSLAGLSFAPWARIFLGQARRVVQDFWIPFPTPQFLYHMSVSIAGGAAMLGCLVLLVLLSFLPASAGDRRAGDVSAQSATRFPIGLPPLAFELGWQKIILLSWGATPLLLGYAISMAGRPLLFDRYLIGSLPPLLLLAARGLQVLRFNRVVLAGAIAALLASSLPVVHAKLTKNMREDVRSAVADFAGRFRSSDEVVFAQPGLSNAVAYYLRAPIEHQATISNPDTDTVDWPGADRVWLFVRDSVAWRSANVSKRIEVSYLREQELHYYGVTVCFYVRRSPPP
jgi:mannosyltransferase